MKLLAHFFPAKKHDGNKSCFHKERYNTFNSQWSTKNITNEPTIIRPVGSKLKLQNNTGGYTNSEVYSKKCHPKLSCFFPLLITCFYIQAFHYRHYYA